MATPRRTPNSGTRVRFANHTRPPAADADSATPVRSCSQLAGVPPYTGTMWTPSAGGTGYQLGILA
ncbi:hypothetical protein ACFQV2_03455 [Actinokineospora soli]|uniref:Uncharacterized protein n=1 Tax=Actinokineospora soli TaxID=1048753 RepID=A0ABW2TIF5_9PSEU